jgi:transcriptional regulator GlxA family with amidase domain
VSDQTLRLRCAEFLGISPSRYVLLRRLKEVRRTLRDADPNMASVAKLARGYGFAEWPVLPGNTARSLAKAHRRR